MKKINKEVKIGLSAIVALFALVYGINYLKGIHLFKPTSYYYVHFENANGLPVSSPVFADGYKIGLVRSIDYDYQHKGHVVAEIDVEPSMRIPKGSTAELEADMLGGLKMKILLANNPRERCEVGDTLQGTLNTGALSRAAEMLPQVEKMVPKIDSILSSLNALLANPALQSTLNNIDRLSGSLANTSEQLEKLMGKEVPALTQKLNTIGDNVVTMTDNLKLVDYAAALQKVDATLANVKALTDKLNQPDNSLGLLMNDRNLYDNLNATGANAAALLEDLKAHPKRYVHFSLFGKKDK